jgi:hypothetical protein
MSMSYTESATESFTLTHAKRLASKVAADLKRFQRFYGEPSDLWIGRYERELVELLRHDAVSEVVYGFKRDGKWTAAAVRYKALAGGLLDVDDDPGRVKPNLDVAGATFTSFLNRNSSYWHLTDRDRQAIEEQAGFSRSTGSTPPLEQGWWAEDLTYSAGGRGLGRSTVRQN